MLPKRHIACSYRSHVISTLHCIVQNMAVRVLEFLKLILSKNVNNKKCAQKLKFFIEKKIEKDSDDFLHRKLTLKVKILTLFESLPLIQNSKFSNFLLVCWFLGKNLSNLVSPIWKLHNLYCHSTET